MIESQSLPWRGYSINVSDKLLNINPKDVELMIVPGGDVTPSRYILLWHITMLMDMIYKLPEL